MAESGKRSFEESSKTHVYSNTDVEELKFGDRDVEDWTAEDVQEWLNDKGYKEEGPLFLAENISGKILAELNRETLKDIGVKSVGKQLELLKIIKSLFAEKEKLQAKDPISSSPSTLKRKITLKDKKTWTPEQKTRYNIKTAIIIREAKKMWSGNEKIYFKSNEKKKLELEELSTKLVELCAIPDIGFGYDAIRAHVIQWAQEKNRRITNGYNYEIEHTPAKRARVHVRRPMQLSVSSDSDSSDTEETSDVQDDPSSSVEDISEKSAKIAVLTAFKCNSLQDLSVKSDLIPIAKQLGVKYRSKGKRELVIPIAKALFQKGYLESAADTVNYKQLIRGELKVLRSLFTDDGSSIDSSEGSVGGHD